LAAAMKDFKQLLQAESDTVLSSPVFWKIAIQTSFLYMELFG
jgi:hypothetical protein